MTRDGNYLLEHERTGYRVELLDHVELGHVERHTTGKRWWAQARCAQYPTTDARTRGEAIALLHLHTTVHRCSGLRPTPQAAERTDQGAHGEDAHGNGEHPSLEVGPPIDDSSDHAPDHAGHVTINADDTPAEIERKVAEAFGPMRAARAALAGGTEPFDLEASTGIVNVPRSEML